MLRQLEDLVISPIDAIVPGPVDVVRGPFVPAPPWPPARRVISVFGRAIRTVEPSPSRDDDGPAFLFSENTWPTDGVADTFTLPGGTDGEIFEVESPPGFAVRRGDDYLLDGDTIRFYRAPAAGAPGVIARIQGDPAHGYTRRRPCVMELEIDVYGRNAQQVDTLLGGSTQVALATLTRAPRFTLAAVAGFTVLTRVIEPRSTVVSIERSDVTVGGNQVFVGALRLELEGQLDLLVANGDPTPTSFIESIEGTVEVVPANGEAPVPQSIVIDPEEPADP